MRHHRAALPALCLSAALLAGALCGCGSTDAARSIRLVTDKTEGFYWENLIAGAQLAADDAGWQLEVALWDEQEGMQAQIDAARQSGAEFLAIASASTEPRLPQGYNGDPEVILIGQQTGDAATVNIAYDSNTVGRAVGTQAGNQIGLQKNFLLVATTETYRFSDRWEDALRNVLGQQGSRVAQRVDCGDDAERAYSLCLAAMDSGVRYDGILCASENATLGALRAVRALGSDVPIIGAEMNDEIALGLRDGQVRGTVVHTIYGCAYMAVENAIRMASGREADGKKTLEALYVDAENMFDDALAPLLYEVK